MIRPAAALAMTVSSLALGLAVANATVPKARPVTVERDRLPVVGAFAVCPELLKSAGDIESKLTVGSAEQGAVEVSAATVMPGAGTGPRVLDAGGRVGSFGAAQDKPVAVAATASGALAGAVEAEQVSRGTGGRQRGLAGTRCESTSPDTWFVGGSTKVGVETELVLVNPYDDRALVDVHVLGVKGPVDAPGGEGIDVGPRQRKVIRLLEIAPEEAATAVHVTVRAGRIAPAMRDARAQADTPNGVDWVPRAGRPATQVDLAGIPTDPVGNGRRLLYLAVPGEDAAVVTVEGYTKDSGSKLVGRDDIEVPGRSVALLDLTEDLGGAAASLRVTSETPVLASVLVENRARFNPIREIAYVGPTAPLSGPALVTDARVPTRLIDVDTHVILSAPDSAARVQISLVPLIGQTSVPAPVTVDIPAGRLTDFRLSTIAGRTPSPARAVVVTPLPGSGPVYGARVIAEVGPRGPLFTVLQLVSQPTTGVPAPIVVPDRHVAVVDPRRKPTAPR